MIKKRCSKNKTRTQKAKKDKPSSQSRNIQSYFHPPGVDPNTVTFMDLASSGDKFLSDNEEFVPEFITTLIPTDAPLSDLKVVTIPVIIKFNDQNIKTRIDIARVKSRVEHQVHVELWKPYLHGKAKTLYYQKAGIFTYLEPTQVLY